MVETKFGKPGLLVRHYNDRAIQHGFMSIRLDKGDAAVALRLEADAGLGNCCNAFDAMILAFRMSWNRMDISRIETQRTKNPFSEADFTFTTVFTTEMGSLENVLGSYASVRSSHTCKSKRPHVVQEQSDLW
eukprot:scaffold10163_cov35-Tisochrysis_lutea.AAC.4